VVATTPPDAGAPLEVVDAGPPAPPDAGPPDAGPPDAGPPDAGAREEAAVVDAGAAPHHSGHLRQAHDALEKLTRACFDEAARIHWGPQRVTLKGKVVVTDGEGTLEEGAVVQNTLHDAKSNACFVSAMENVRFKPVEADVGQEKTFTFDYVPMSGR
jgi:hypothetical protein